MKLFHLAALTVGLLLLSHTDLSAQTGKGDQKSTIIQIDISKLPPDLAKALIEFAKKQKGTGKGSEMKGAADAISLVEAIGIAEKASKGRATSADRKDGLDYTHFTVTITHVDGTRTRYTLGATGKILQERNYQKERD